MEVLNEFLNNPESILGLAMSIGFLFGCFFITIFYIGIELSEMLYLKLPIMRDRYNKFRKSKQKPKNNNTEE